MKAILTLNPYLPTSIYTNAHLQLHPITSTPTNTQNPTAISIEIFFCHFHLRCFSFRHFYFRCYWNESCLHSNEKENKVLFPSSDYKIKKEFHWDFFCVSIDLYQIWKWLNLPKSHWDLICRLLRLFV